MRASGDVIAGVLSDAGEGAVSSRQLLESGNTLQNLDKTPARPQGFDVDAEVALSSEVQVCLRPSSAGWLAGTGRWCCMATLTTPSPAKIPVPSHSIASPCAPHSLARPALLHQRHGGEGCAAAAVARSTRPNNTSRVQKQTSMLFSQQRLAAWPNAGLGRMQGLAECRACHGT